MLVGGVGLGLLWVGYWVIGLVRVDCLVGLDWVGRLFVYRSSCPICRVFSQPLYDPLELDLRRHWLLQGG